jgi:threonine dehydratase
MNVTPELIDKAAAQIARATIATPTVPAPRLSALTGADIVLKLENLQHTGSFKARGALVKLESLDESSRRRGVIAMSAGNHAQGVAFHCQRMAIPATIVMPKATPFTKVERTNALGAKVLLQGETLSEAAAFAREHADAKGLTFIHPYDDPLIVAGQGTVAREILAAAPDLDVLVVPVGGGGLIAGCAIAAKAIKPAIRVVGVQAALYPAMTRSAQGEMTSAGGGSTLAEGIAVKEPGVLTRSIIKQCVDDMLLVGEPLLERAVNLMIAEAKVTAEGAGAAPLAAVLAEPERFRGKRVGLVVSGGNIDARIVASILTRGLLRDGRIARLRVEITDAPGMLARVAAAIADAGGNVIEIYHHRLFQDVPVTRADLDIVLETRNLAHLEDIVARIEATGITVRLLGNTAETSP